MSGTREFPGISRGVPGIPRGGAVCEGIRLSSANPLLSVDCIKPPSCSALPLGSRLPFEIDRHSRALLGQNLEPVFAKIPLAAAMFAGPVFLPDRQNGRDGVLRISPYESLWQSRLAPGHSGRIERPGQRLDRLTDEFLCHVHESPRWPQHARTSP